MSPSRRPTRAPVCASAMARFAATVLFPTPPLPEPTAITGPTPSSALRSADGSRGFRTRLVVLIFTSVTPAMPLTARRQSSSICAFNGHADVVSTSVNATTPPSTATSSIIPSVTRSRCRSGSFTVPSAASTASGVITCPAAPMKTPPGGSGPRSAATLPPFPGAIENDGRDHRAADQERGDDDPVAIEHALLGVHLRDLRQLVAQVALDAVPERGRGAVAATARAVEPDRDHALLRHVHQLQVAPVRLHHGAELLDDVLDLGAHVTSRAHQGNRVEYAPCVETSKPYARFTGLIWPRPDGCKAWRRTTFARNARRARCSERSRRARSGGATRTNVEGRRSREHRPSSASMSACDLVEPRLELAPRGLVHRRRVHRLQHQHEVVEVLVAARRDARRILGRGCRRGTQRLVPAQPPRARVLARALERD